MSAILGSLGRTVVAGFVLAAVFFLLAYLWIQGWDGAEFWSFLFRWLHVLSGIMWVGLLWYFNFVQIPGMPSIPDEQKPAISKVIAPRALFWFRWAAMATIVTGLILIGFVYGWVNYHHVITAGLSALGDGYNVRYTIIGVAIWLGIVMWFNVWFVIWPNQKKALGIVQASDEEKAKAARRALLISRINTALSVPMLFGMVGGQNLT